MDHMTDDIPVAAYLDRIGATRPDRPDIGSLRHLQERHVLSVPFENLDYHLDRPIFMDERVLDKIVHQHRGGGCYEVNPAFAFLLRALGYRVEIHPGRVYRPGGVLGPAMCHLALRVELEETWLVDVGFGRNSRLPLRWNCRLAQQDPDGEYRIQDAEDGGIDVYLNGRPLYRLDTRPCRLEDFQPTLWWWRTSPQSPFLQEVFCTLRTETGRVTLKGNTLTVVDGAERTTEELSDDALFAAYRKYFGFNLDRLPRQPEATDQGVAGPQLV